MSIEDINTQEDPEVRSCETMCAICHQPITAVQRDEYLPCAHRYHAVCMEEYGVAMGCQWQDLPCPTCKVVPAHVQAPEQLQLLNMNADIDIIVDIGIVVDTGIMDEMAIVVVVVDSGIIVVDILLLILILLLMMIGL